MVKMALAQVAQLAGLIHAFRRLLIPFLGQGHIVGSIPDSPWCRRQPIDVLSLPLSTSHSKNQ